MSEIRKDPFSGSYILYAKERRNRPNDFMNPTNDGQILTAYMENCPFCKGNEEMAGETIYEHQGPHGDWDMKIIKNIYPAISKNSGTIGMHSIYETVSGKGTHDVVVDTPYHNIQLHNQKTDRIERLFGLLAMRYKALYARPDVMHIQIFKNTGKGAGASKIHSHWQIVAGGYTPSLQMSMMHNLNRYYQSTGKCLYCQLIEQESMQKVHVVAENERFLAICPFASRFTYETWILPKNHTASIAQLSPEDFKPLAKLFKSVIGAVTAAIKIPEYNICLMEMGKEDTNALFHWHIQIIPRRGNMAGYEFSTGSYINSLFPDKAAEALRGYLRKSNSTF